MKDDKKKIEHERNDNEYLRNQYIIEFRVMRKPTMSWIITFV